jgi:raffinose/stachyose/melibiose transport system substrate-binding protein
MIRSFLRWVREHFALLFVAVVFAWSGVAIFSYRRAEAPPGVKIVLRLGHWQLEAGVRDAFERLAADYRKIHPEVQIVQDAVPEGTYGQWMTTQLMGGTAPDIMEVGLGLPYNILLGYFNRYFLPLNAYVNQPNPYNRGTDLEHVPWRQTYKDGMRNSYIEEMQAHMTVPLSQFGIRIFYNRDLLRKLTGLEQVPRDYRGFLAVCEKIGDCRDARGRPYVPITGSAYHVGFWDGFMCEPLTFGAVRRADFNRDGAVGNDELFAAFQTGRIGFDFPPFEAKFRMLRQLTAHFQPGFTGLGRDEAVFLFAQQRAVFITTGTWDAGSLIEQAKGVFDVGVMDFPMPGNDDPEFGAIVEGPVYERPSAGFPFAITRTCRHPEAALDFMQFVASRAGNEKLNRIIGWIPAIRGAAVPALVAQFEPHLEGVFGAMPMTLGGETIIKWQQLYALYQVNQISYTNLAERFLPFYLKQGPRELDEAWRNRRRAVVREEQVVMPVRVRCLRDPTPASWVRYRQLTTGRLLLRDLHEAIVRQRLEAGAAEAGAPAPYDFSPAVRARVRARLLAEEGRR